jgi:hypothetical protein
VIGSPLIVNKILGNLISQKEKALQDCYLTDELKFYSLSFIYPKCQTPLSD